MRNVHILIYDLEKIDYQRSQSYHWFSSIYGLQLGHRLVFEPLQSRVWTNSWSTFSKLRKFPRSTVNYHNPRGRHSRRIWVLKMLAERLLIVRGPGSCCLVSKYNIPSWNLTVKFYRKQGSTDQNRLVLGQARTRTGQNFEIWDRNGPEPTKFWKSGAPWIPAPDFIWQRKKQNVMEISG